jgi:hypothetical protein
MVGQYKGLTQKEYNKKYYDLNRTKLLEKIKCINCNGSYSLATSSQHMKTNKHLKSIQNELWNEIRKFELEEDNNIDKLFI